jgi:hypothetical protein
LKPLDKVVEAEEILVHPLQQEDLVAAVAAQYLMLPAVLETKAETGQPDLYKEAVVAEWLKMLPQLDLLLMQVTEKQTHLIIILTTTVVVVAAEEDLPVMVINLVVELEALEEAAVDHGNLLVVPEQLHPRQQEMQVNLVLLDMAKMAETEATTLAEELEVEDTLVLGGVNLEAVIV